MVKSLVVGLLLFTTSAFGQVAISLSVLESFDNNVFLESGEPVVIPEGIDFTPSDRLDGSEDSDFITFAGLKLSTAFDYPSVANVSASVDGGVFIFSDFNELNRFSVNSSVDVRASEALLPGVNFGIFDKISTGSRNIGTTDSSVSNSLTTHSVGLNLGSREIALSDLSSTSLGYTFSRTDTLGDLTISTDEQDELEAELAGTTDEGSDYYTHVLSNNSSYRVSQYTELGLTFAASILDFININGNDIEQDDQDRKSFDVRAGVTTQASSSLSLSAGAGFSLSRFDEARSPRSVTVVNPEDGTTTVAFEQPDQNQTDFVFDASGVFTPSAGTSFGAGISQQVGTDTDGDRILTRSVNINASKELTDRLVVTGTGRFFQFTSSDSLSTSSDRFELGATARYQITPYIAVSAGYNFTTQDADEQEAATIFDRTRDYDVHRAFLTLDAGIVGLLDG